MANFPTLGAQQETNRKILEDLQLKKQLLQKGNIPGLGTGISTNSLYQIPASQLLQSSDFSQSSGLANAPRSVFNATTSTTLGYFVSQDSYYGNTFIPVLPRLDPTLYGDIQGKYIGDLGCGSGMLSIGSFLLGAGMTTGFEIDDDALNTFQSNVSDMELPGIDCILCDVLTLSNSEKWENAFDTIITNPPFGTKNNSGIDMLFVQTGITLASGAVYSFHKSSTRDYINKKVKDWHVKGNVVAELKYNIDTSYSFHKSKSVDINVDFWRFDVSEKNV